jgi:hypothetical protein
MASLPFKLDSLLVTGSKLGLRTFDPASRSQRADPPAVGARHQLRRGPIQPTPPKPPAFQRRHIHPTPVFKAIDPYVACHRRVWSRINVSARQLGGGGKGGSENDEGQCTGKPGLRHGFSFLEIGFSPNAIAPDVKAR